MKFNFDIECTPEEARRFFGLPDVVPMQERAMQRLEERMMENIGLLDPEALLRTWGPMGAQNWAEMQKMFWGQMGFDTSGQKSGGQKSGAADKTAKPGASKSK